MYKRAIASTQQELLQLRGRVEHLSKSEESARLEAKTGREELKRARKEWLKMKDDLDAEKEAHRQTKVGMPRGGDVKQEFGSEHTVKGEQLCARVGCACCPTS